jgi:hypothetical protein
MRRVSHTKPTTRPTSYLDSVPRLRQRLEQIDGVVGVGDRAAAVGEARQVAHAVVGVAERAAAGQGLADRGVEPVVAEARRPRVVGQAGEVVGVVAVGDLRAPGIGDLRHPVERIISVGRDLPLPVLHRLAPAEGVVGNGGPAEWGGRSDARQVPPRVVAVAGHVTARVGRRGEGAIAVVSILILILGRQPICGGGGVAGRTIPVGDAVTLRVGALGRRVGVCAVGVGPRRRPGRELRRGQVVPAIVAVGGDLPRLIGALLDVAVGGIRGICRVSRGVPDARHPPHAVVGVGQPADRRRGVRVPAVPRPRAVPGVGDPSLAGEVAHRVVGEALRLTEKRHRRRAAARLTVAELPRGVAASGKHRAVRQPR